MSLKTKIRSIGWSALGLCCVILLVAAMKTKDSKACSSVIVNIDGIHQHVFVQKDDVLEVLAKNNIRPGKTLEDINLKNAEEQLEKNVWIKDAELFFDNRQALHVKIEEREPLARVFTINGSSFYIDSTGLRLPVNENATARVIVFTSFPSDKKVLSKPDSLVLNDVKKITQYITADSFMNEQTAQINIMPQGTYEITPVVGDQLIRIGNADSLNEKFTKLLAFYQQVWSKGFEKYSVIDVQYEGQVVAVRKGEGYTISDTAKAMKQLKRADTQLKTVLNDTTYSSPVAKKIVVEPAPVVTSKPVKKTEHKTDIKKKAKTTAKKTDNKKKKAGNNKPKAVMKKRS